MGVIVIALETQMLERRHLSLGLRSELSLEPVLFLAPVYVLPTRQSSASLEGDQVIPAGESYTSWVFFSIKKKKVLQGPV